MQMHIGALNQSEIDEFAGKKNYPESDDSVERENKINKWLKFNGF